MMWVATLALGLAGLAGPVWAQTGPETCARMKVEDRLGPLSEAQCQCNYSVADQVLDADIRALLFDAWYNGNDNMAKVEQLKPRHRVRREMLELRKAIQKHCS
ncbi:hypothetical protein [uncultured Tateyamaria sp.]|uniref:hypothetical protein n=1 Tax=uncultured Tateyamaria sp. TaxID=455651 RepID=UPI00262A2086|nr:hypothetical protein [uncultured Tateyamaria sp.]